MSAAQAGPAAAVTKPSKCDRIVFFGRDTHVIKHNWRLDAARGEVLLVTKLVDSRNPNRASNAVQAFVANTENALSSKAAKMACSILKNKRDRFLMAQQGKAGGSSSELVLKREGGGRLTREYKNRLAGLGELKVMQHTGKRRNVRANKPVSGEETVVARKVK